MVVIGGGEVALRKIEGLLESGAKVKVVDPHPNLKVLGLARRGSVRLLRRRYRAGDLGQAFAAIAATDDREVNRKIYSEAVKKRILLNSVDKPEFCSFVFPARISRGEFLVTISTGGASPAFSKKIREDLEQKFGPEYELMTDLMVRLRKYLPGGSETGRKFSRFVRSPVLSFLKKKKWPQIDRLLRHQFGNGLTLRTLGLRIR